MIGYVLSILICVAVVIVLRSNRLFKNNRYWNNKGFRLYIVTFIMMFWFWFSRTFLRMNFYICFLIGLVLMVVSGFNMIKNMNMNMNMNSNSNDEGQKGEVDLQQFWESLDDNIRENHLSELAKRYGYNYILKAEVKENENL